jgi:ribosome-binding factor A
LRYTKKKESKEPSNMTDRLTRVNQLIRIEVSKILREEVDAEEALITVTKVVSSPTLEHATVFISVFPIEKVGEILGKINHKIYTIQQQLNKKLFMRIVPKLRFEIDLTEERAEKIEKLIEKIVK